MKKLYSAGTPRFPARLHLQNCQKHFTRRYYNNQKSKRNSVFEVTLDEIGEIISNGNTAEKTAEVKELSKAIEAFLDSLTKENRIIFMRRYAFCDSYKDIAKLLGLSEKTVSVRLVRIRKDIKKLLGKE